MSKYCPKCGNELPDDAQFCNDCGYSVLVEDKKEETPKKEVEIPKKEDTPKKDVDEILFNETSNESKSEDKIFSNKKPSFNLPKNKILIPIVVVVIIIAGIAIFSGDLFYNPDDISITITDISGYSGDTSYYYYVNAIFSHLPSNTEGYFLKTTYYDSNGNSLATTTEGLNMVQDSEYGSTFAYYDSPKQLDIDHAKVEITHNGEVIKEVEGDFDKNKLDFQTDSTNNTTQS